MRGVWCQAPSLSRPPVPCGGHSGFRDPCVPVAVGVGVGTQHRPHSVRPCGPALRAVGVVKGRPWGGVSRRCERRLRSGAHPPPAACPLGGLSGSATHVLWARLCGPRTGPVARMPCGGLRAGGVVGGVWVGALPSPDARPLNLNGLPGLAGHVLWARVWVCALCVVSVRCLPWCVVLPFVFPSGAPLSGALLRCCARRVLAVPPSLRASLAWLLATSCFFRGFVARYPFRYSLLARPPPWHALFPCLRPGVCLGRSPCLRGVCCVTCVVSWTS